MSAEQEDALTDWIKETPCLYQKGLREYRDINKRSRLWAKKLAEMKMTCNFSFLNFSRKTVTTQSELPAVVGPSSTTTSDQLPPPPPYWYLSILQVSLPLLYPMMLTKRF